MIGLAAAIVALGAAAILVWGVSAPVDVSAGAPDVPGLDISAKLYDKNTSDRNPNREETLDLSELQRLCAKDFHRPLYDPEPKERKVSKTSKKTPMTMRLVGTATEPGHSVAILLSKDGSVELCSPGQSIETACGTITVTRVEHRKATVRHGGKTYELEIEDEKQR